MNKASTQHLTPTDPTPPTHPAAPREPVVVAADPAGDDAAFARRVLQAEADAIRQIRVTEAFDHAVEVITQRTAGQAGGTVVVSGLGKSGLIGQKISATLASTGTPSHFLHPTEAMHGDLGRVRRGDVVLILSFGGTTEEVVSLAAILRQDGVPVVAVVGKPDCELARLATAALCVGDLAEACPHNLAPTASTTAMLALGDALALAVSRRANFDVEAFRKVHPGGSLGRQLTPIVTVMRLRAGDNLPLVPDTATVQEAIGTQTSTGRRAGAVLVVDDSGLLAGIFTDGDLRRLLIERGADAMGLAIREVMTAGPRCLGEDSLVRDAVRMVREHRIDEIPVVSGDGRPLGLVDVQDLVALKVIDG